MAGSPARSGVEPAYLVQATLLSVNSKTHVAEVALDNIQGALPDVAVAALYCHPLGGEGAYFLPEPGATCYVTFPSDGSRPFVSHFVMPPTAQEGDAGGREELNPGDLILTTRDDNFVRILRGGLVEIGANRLCQRMYIPLSNFVRDLFQNYEALSPAGTVRWTVEQNLIDQSKVEYLFHLKEHAEDPFARLLVEVGEHETQDWMPEGSADPLFPQALSYLRLYVTGPTVAEHTVALQMSQAGQVFLKTQGYLYLYAKGPFRVQGEADLELVGPAYFSKVSTLGAKSEEMTSWEVDVTGAIIFKANLTLLEGMVALGGPVGLPPVNANFVTWAQTFALAVAGELPAVAPVATIPPNVLAIKVTVL